MKSKSIFSLWLICGIYTTSFAQWAVQPAATHLYTIQDMHFKNNVDGFAVGSNQVPNGNARISKTTDGAASWTLILDIPPAYTPSVYNFNDLFFVNNSVGYAVGGYSSGGKGIIAKTIDGGNNWDTLNHNHPESRILGAYFFTATDGYSTGEIIYKTTDGGLTWSNMIAPIGSYDDIQFINQDTGFAFNQYSNEIIRSTDGGANWSTITLPTTEDIRVLRFGNGMGFAGCENSTILKTTDGGNNWTTTVNNVAGSPSTAMISLFITTATTAFAGNSDGIILRSMDAGATWNENYDLESSPLVPIGQAECFAFPHPSVGYASSGFATVAKTPNGGGPVGSTGPTGPITINELPKNGVFTVFPNPASQKLEVRTPYFEDNSTVTLRSMNGLLHGSVILHTNRQVIDISDLPKGIYIVEYKSGTSASTQRFVKM